MPPVNAAHPLISNPNPILSLLRPVWAVSAIISPYRTEANSIISPAPNPTPTPNPITNPNPSPIPNPIPNRNTNLNVSLTLS